MGRPNKNLDETSESIHTSSTSVNNKSVSNSTIISNYGSNLISSTDYPDNLIIGTLKSPKTGVERRKSNDKHIYTKTQRYVVSTSCKFGHLISKSVSEKKPFWELLGGLFPSPGGSP